MHVDFLFFSACRTSSLVRCFLCTINFKNVTPWQWSCRTISFKSQGKPLLRCPPLPSGQLKNRMVRTSSLHLYCRCPKVWQLYIDATPFPPRVVSRAIGSVSSCAEFLATLAGITSAKLSTFACVPLRVYFFTSLSKVCNVLDWQLVDLFKSGVVAPIHQSSYRRLSSGSHEKVFLLCSSPFPLPFLCN